jgi:hypothetical protein
MISTASGFGGPPPLQFEHGHDVTAMARSISARNTIESPARDFGGKNSNRPSAKTWTG